MPCVQGQAKDFTCACVRTFVTCWEVLRAVDQTLAVALHLFKFGSLFVDLLCGKPEIESVMIGSNWEACLDKRGLHVLPSRG